MICESCGSRDVSFVKTITDSEIIRPSFSEAFKIFELFRCNKCGHTFKVERTF